ncbi:hypothetical protein [Pseudomonas syringae]|uniref:hypothetical protein n=1 Tax=Pseudomonas syringae TaxID=317 RepID=UPI000464D838|nr:hypothetical protein [Pseudomonas syringae]
MEFRDYAIIAAALVGAASLVLSLITLVMKGEENRRTIRSQLTDVLARLNVVNAESRKYRIETAETCLTPEKRAMFSFYNDQRAFLVGQARYLMDQLPDHVSDSEFGLVAKALGNIGDHELACHYWEKCLERSPSDYVQGLHSRAFGGYLFNEGYPELGRFRFRSSVDLITGTSDQRRFHRVETYLRWAGAERFSGFSSAAEDAVGKALAEASLIQSQSMQNRCSQTIRDYREELPHTKVNASNQAMS